MAGHSKWAGIKHKKAVVDARRGKLFAKLIRGIEVAAREGGTSNPENNMTLAAASIARSSTRVPAETIERAAKRGAGELGDDVKYERVMYEGYAPRRCCRPDRDAHREPQPHRVPTSAPRSRARTATSGSRDRSPWMFDRLGDHRRERRHGGRRPARRPPRRGADDIRHSGDGRWEVVHRVKDFARVARRLAAAGLADRERRADDAPADDGAARRGRRAAASSSCSTCSTSTTMSRRSTRTSTSPTRCWPRSRSPVGSMTETRRVDALLVARSPAGHVRVASVDGGTHPRCVCSPARSRSSSRVREQAAARQYVHREAVAELREPDGAVRQQDAETRTSETSAAMFRGLAIAARIA